MTTVYRNAVLREIDARRRWLRAVLSQEQIDGMGELVIVRGIDVSRADRNLPLLADHDPTRPLGQWVRTWIEDRPSGRALLGEAEGTPPGISAVADQCWGEIQSGVRRGISIGFRSLKTGPPQLAGQTGVTHLRTELLEASSVAMPACPSCLVERKQCRCATPSALRGPGHEILDLDWLDDNVIEIEGVETRAELEAVIRTVARDYFDALHTHLMGRR